MREPLGKTDRHAGPPAMIENGEPRGKHVKIEQIMIDTEFNEFRGDLISLACVAETGPEFYAVITSPNPGAWVAANVLPVLGQAPESLFVLSIRLREYLAQFEACNIMADWPEDIAHFCKAMIVGPGQRIPSPPLTFTLVNGYAETSETSAIPHNALEDARALMISIKTNRRRGR